MTTINNHHAIIDYSSSTWQAHQQHQLLNPDMALHQYNISSSTYTSSIERYYISVATHSIGIICYLILVIIMTTLLIKRWKEMIPFKRFFYISLIFTAILQILSQGFGISHDIGTLTGMAEYLTQLFFIIYYCGLVSTVVMCTYFQAMVSKVLYGIYFHESHCWMRKGAESYSFNEKLRIFTKYYSIGMTLIWSIAFVILVPFTLICSMVYYMDGGNTRLGSILGIWSIITVAIVGLVNSVCAMITGILNFTLVIRLSRYLLHQNGPIAIPRRNSCKKLVLLTFGQFYMALINSISIILGAIGIWYPYLFILTGVIHRFVFLLFAICVSFSFGPMDFFHYELNINHSQNDKTTKKVTQEETQSSSQVTEMLSNIEKPNPKTSDSFNIDSKAFRKANEISSLMEKFKTFDLNNISSSTTTTTTAITTALIQSPFSPIVESTTTDFLTELQRTTCCNYSNTVIDIHSKLKNPCVITENISSANIQEGDVFVEIPLN